MAFYLKCLPYRYYKSIYDIDYQLLQEQGIKSLFFDLDNTLISYKVTKLTPEIITFLNDLANKFNVVIVSNSYKKRVVKAVEETNFPYVYYAKKPLKWGIIKALKTNSLKSFETVLIGDQLLTDIWGAKRMKMKSILVTPIDMKTDGFTTKINRLFENHILKKMKKKQPKLYQERLEEYAKARM